MMCFPKTNARKRFEALIRLPLQKFQVFFPHASKICPHRMSSSKASWSPTSSTITTGAKTFTTDLRRCKLNPTGLTRFRSTFQRHQRLGCWRITSTPSTMPNQPLLPPHWQLSSMARDPLNYLVFPIVEEHLWLDKKDWTLNICSPVCFNNRNIGWSILLI